MATREILFRGFHPCENGKTTITLDGKQIRGEWVLGWYVKAMCHWHKYGIHNDWIICSSIQNGGLFNVTGRFAVIPETVGQFINVTDIKKRKIFEHDILFNHIYNVVSGAVEYGEGTYDSGIYRYTGFYHTFDGDVDDKAICQSCIDKFNEFEVIGNVFEHPELLEKK